jgi:hypothetical protein
VWEERSTVHNLARRVDDPASFGQQDQEVK